jgi:hypothetical protein
MLHRLTIECNATAQHLPASTINKMEDLQLEEKIQWLSDSEPEPFLVVFADVQCISIEDKIKFEILFDSHAWQQRINECVY